VTLFTYIKTRAGTQWPKLFENEEHLKSLKIARWHIFIACVCDLSLFLGFSAAYAETGNMLRVNDKLAETVLANGKILLGTKNTFDFAATLQHDFHAFSISYKGDFYYCEVNKKGKNLVCFSPNE
tara:strand:- start:424 stop:798 length:375 start_codon:yes stop_codon:yes gene_type:complete